jgi:hypothetical protein
MRWITDTNTDTDTGRAPLAALRDRTRSIIAARDDEAFLAAFDVDTPTALEAGRIRHEELRNLGPDESTTRVIAARLGCSIRTANRRLAELAGAGEVEFRTPEYARLARQGRLSRELIVRRIPENGSPAYGSAERRKTGAETAGRPRVSRRPEK